MMIVNKKLSVDTDQHMIEKFECKTEVAMMNTMKVHTMNFEQ